MVVKYIVYDNNKVKGLEMFHGIAPLSEDSHRFIKGNAGFEHVFSWNANNKAHAAGGTTIKNAKSQTKATGNHKYFLWFESREDLTLALFHLFNQDHELVNEFYKSDSRFAVTEKSCSRTSTYWRTRQRITTNTIPRQSHPSPSPHC